MGVRPVRERNTLLLSVLLSGGMAIGSYWLAQQARLSDVDTRKPGHDIDYTANDITLTRMDDTGRAQYVIDATKLIHYFDDDTGELTQPRIVGSKINRPEMHLRADLGKTTSDGQEVRLYGNVVLTRAPWKHVAELVAKSDYMLAFPEREIVETDHPISIVRGNSSVDANSMHYDNATQRVNFEGGKGGRVREVLEPRTVRTPTPPPAPVKK
jgi:lipopolysaccharide export system protein LptC